MYLPYTTCAVLLLFVAWIVKRAYERGREAEQGLAAALFHLGMAYMHDDENMDDDADDVRQNVKRSIDYLRKAAEHGHAKAAFVLGLTYFRGLSSFEDYEVEKDYAEAYTWFDYAVLNEQRRYETGRLSWREKRSLAKYLAETRQEFEKRQAASNSGSDPE